MNKNFDLENLVRPNVAKLKPYSSARDEFQSTGTEMIFLDANENPFQTDVNRYPDPQQRDLKAVLANNKALSIKNILLGNGSDEVLDLLFRAFCEPGKDNVITLPPTYGMYAVLANINNVENREVMLRKNFEPNISEILKMVGPGTKMIFLCSPNNPTGNSFSEEVVSEILESFNGIVVIDEAYIDFSEQESWVKKLQQNPNLVITQTLSKAYGMAGIRLGICYASEEIIRILNKIKPPYNVNQLTQQRAIERLSNQNEIEKEVADIKEERSRLFEVLLQLEYVKKVYRSDANFLLVEVDNANKRYDQLLEKGIVIRNRTTQALCGNTLRFTVGTRAENEELTKALKDLEQIEI